MINYMYSMYLVNIKSLQPDFNEAPKKNESKKYYTNY